ncbi:MAG: putative tRNA threonylcarbamoyladenosine biosynthesis protein Gcp [Candidatus Nomurabacteria bacterium GW2011_GWF2_35_66]|uniref:tRNA N6-adenosine threonylcarbamoyltransferase n=1 Tax=Candidatus Nomurabacteria bacterium GW2011_GWE1_35_16 TaxID=1618761 RepID=A0A0G0BA10_9BACT|nr:MAG: putative tRNA threonylcarbamoyladenosine biosynthesis protein Gcp [Candidatus Nomurabacteria bacterium GW2011_GWF1_34_20]KKP62869.1 MAG: putative tRNA threonylcarbamoyladenosine biosynthesis protein Gcp [Candidatus Nomurabacteria bacterium GW2011_GWE2_34_25]KKP66268.1 MAG: putative tRNA threonylcarbamoyladenosine biosynthesis protein Gcp [Candidatus Nomurabacteria bacterium GW2011_GWE1_35_16]KKP83101.1 MAG: putative tRNA threonylcarbamoyladenosine biosynthesis protein Gcp [Candidatus Nom
MRILAIETSCDETAIAIVEVKRLSKSDTFKILANNVNSQIEIHKEYGGVFPAMAKREHIKNLPLVLEKTLKDAKIKIEKIDAIAVTTGPGLEPALWTGIVFAKELSLKYNIPIVPVNHMEGHIFSIFPKKGKTFKVDTNEKIFPMLSLLVSGGHTELILVKNWHKYKKLGQTRDDASGEAFDKVARMMSLPYPGGPEISRLANEERSRVLSGSIAQAVEPSISKKFSRILLRADGKNMTSDEIILPRPMIYSKDYDFSFSGLKTAVLYLIRDLKEKNPNVLENINIKQKIAKEFEDAVVETLVHKTIKAIKQYKIKTLIVGGGVSANTYLQEQMNKEIKKLRKSDFLNTKVHFPVRALTGDNALMIAIAGYYQAKNKKFVKNINKIKAEGNLSL